MHHLTHITRRRPAPATTLLQWQQKAVVFGSFATGLASLATAFNTFTQGMERKNPDE